MNRNLIILRHGKSDWNTGVSSDFDRPLAKRGQKAVKRIGQWLVDQGLFPDYIISSPAVRARQTATGICKATGIAKSRIHWEPVIYGAGMSTLLDVLAACPREVQCAMIIGHNPGLEMLLRYLAGKSIEAAYDDNPMPTAALAHLTMPEDWEKLDDGDGQMAALIHPRKLKDI